MRLRRRKPAPRVRPVGTSPYYVLPYDPERAPKPVTHYVQPTHAKKPTRTERIIDAKISADASQVVDAFRTATSASSKHLVIPPGASYSVTPIPDDAFPIPTRPVDPGVPERRGTPAPTPRFDDFHGCTSG